MQQHRFMDIVIGRNSVGGGVSIYIAIEYVTIICAQSQNQYRLWADATVTAVVAVFNCILKL